MNRISFFHHPARVKRSLAPALFAAGLQLSLVVVPSGSLRADQDDNRAYLPAGFLDVSTVASNGDQNPYGVAFVPDGFPSGKKLSPGDILVSNFNNAGTSPTGNIQGTGTTITRVAPVARPPRSLRELFRPQPTAA